MNILLPIASNTLLVAIIALGIILGRKNGLKIELTKLALLAGSIVGIYFLTSTVVLPAVLNLDFIKTVLAENITSLNSLTTALYALETAVSYIALSGVLSIIKRVAIKHKLLANNLGKAKTVRLKGMTKESNKELKRENKQLIKATIKPSKASRVIGAIAGGLVGLLLTFVIILPIKYLAKDASKIMNNETIETVYTYTPYGQLEKVFNFTDFIVK